MALTTCHSGQILSITGHREAYLWTTHGGAKLDHLYVVHPGKLSVPLTRKITASTLADALKLL